MSSYIKFMFKYLFDHENLPADLDQRQAANASLASSSSSQATATTSNIDARLQQRQPQAAPHLDYYYPAPGRPTTIGELSQLLNNLNDHDHYLEEQDQQQQHAAAAAAADQSSGLRWSRKCLRVARMFVSALSNQTTTTTTPAIARDDGGLQSSPFKQQIVSTDISSSYNITAPATTTAAAASAAAAPTLLDPNQRPFKLGSFAEFEHLIRKQLASIANLTAEASPWSSSSSAAAGSSSVAASPAWTASEYPTSALGLDRQPRENQNTRQASLYSTTSSTGHHHHHHYQSTSMSTSTYSSSPTGTINLSHEAAPPPPPPPPPSMLTSGAETISSSSARALIEEALVGPQTLRPQYQASSSFSFSSSSPPSVVNSQTFALRPASSDGRANSAAGPIGAPAAEPSWLRASLHSASSSIIQSLPSIAPTTTATPTQFQAAIHSNATIATNSSHHSNATIEALSQHQQRAPPLAAMLLRRPPQQDDQLLNVNSFELLECYNQLQLHDYYNGYDIFIGLRIATTLTILFVVFILFVIYKTGCRGDEGSSRSQLRLASSGAKSTTNTNNNTKSFTSSSATNDHHSRQGTAKTKGKRYRDFGDPPNYGPARGGDPGMV